MGILFLVFDYYENLIYQVDITAHRGSSIEAPENTLEAIELAIANGATYAEIDVQEISDGTIVLFHDKNIKRITGEDIPIWELTKEYLPRLDAGSWFDESYSHARIPTLENVITQTESKIKLNIELKSHGHERDFFKHCS